MPAQEQHAFMVQGNNFNHLGGIAVGGGMLEGLGSLLFKNAQGQEINEFATQGSRDETRFIDW